MELLNLEGDLLTYENSGSLCLNKFGEAVESLEGGLFDLLEVVLQDLDTAGGHHNHLLHQKVTVERGAIKKTLKKGGGGLDPDS